MGGYDEGLAGAALNSEPVGLRIVARRTVLHLSQARLARRAGVRVETLNRIERGHTTPDFATLRKLVLAMNTAAAPPPSRAICKEKKRQTAGSAR